MAGFPGSGQRIQKAAFIKPIREDNKFDLYVIDKQKDLKMMKNMVLIIL